MKKAIQLFTLFCLSIVSMCGCAQTEATPLCRVVTSVDISCQQEDVLISRHYTNMEKMENVLLYLRLLKPGRKPQTDPEELDADVYEITVSLSDGEKKTYRQKDHRYLAEGDRPWQTIDPEQAAGLYRLMRQQPSDSV